MCENTRSLGRINVLTTLVGKSLSVFERINKGTWLGVERFPAFRMPVWQCQWGGVFLAASRNARVKGFFALFGGRVPVSND
jgi:hypothetical protein